MEELKFDNETAEALYYMFSGLSRSCYERAEVYEEAKPDMKKAYEEAKPDMKKAYEKVLDWGRRNYGDMRDEKSGSVNIDDD